MGEAADPVSRLRRPRSERQKQDEDVHGMEVQQGGAVGGDLRGVAVGLILFSSLDSVWILVFSVPLNCTVPFSQPYRVPV